MPLTRKAAVARCAGAGFTSFCAVFSLSWPSQASAAENVSIPASSDDASASFIFMAMVDLPSLAANLPRRTGLSMRRTRGQMMPGWAGERQDGAEEEGGGDQGRG